MAYHPAVGIADAGGIARLGTPPNEIAAILAEHAIEYLEGPIQRVTGFDTPFPYTLEHVYMPHAERVLKAVEDVMTF